MEKEKQKTEKRIIGDLGEDEACRFLIAKNYEIMARNYNCKFGEIDIIARKDGTLVFVEVKTRKNNFFGEPQEFVNFQKLEKMNMAIDCFLNNYDIPEDYDLRIDVVEIMFDEKRSDFKINHIEDFNN